MAISVSFAWHLVVRNKRPLTESARIQIQDKLLFYQEQRDEATKRASKAGNVADKLAKILECDDKLKCE